MENAATQIFLANRAKASLLECIHAHTLYLTHRSCTGTVLTGTVHNYVHKCARTVHERISFRGAEILF